jgi:hypothetical protein
MTRTELVRRSLAAGSLFILSIYAAAAAPADVAIPAQQVIDDLLKRLAASEARISLLEQRLGAAPVRESAALAQPLPETATHIESPADMPHDPADHDLMMALPSGPKLKIGGFADFNFGTGTVANPLVYPQQSSAKSQFQIGQIALFLTSQVSERWSFVSEIGYTADSTNAWGFDIERLQLTYKMNPYFSITGGRYHSAIGYYNTAYHHGTWFQTAQGRPFMYYFEDSGGILPVHNVGLSATGLVRGAEKIGLHWVAEAGNGRSTHSVDNPVQNVVSDRNRKSVNFAAYIQPEAVPGLQIGGSFYLDKLSAIGNQGRPTQRVSSAYAVWTNPSWEFLNEAVLLSNVLPSGKSYNTPLAYTQLSRKFGIYRPYVRYQYVNVPAADPVNIFNGRYDGPSVGLRIDATDYAAFKLQYNRIYMRQPAAANGLNAQISFAF